MREIRFKALRIDGNGWVHGLVYNYSYRNEIFTHIQDDAYAFKNGSYYGSEVDPKTIGQFTGLKDKNGKEIYDGDVLSNGKYHFEVQFNIQQGKWSLNPFKCLDEHEEWFLTALEYQQLGNGYYSRKDLEIIGNIHDSKEQKHS